MEIKNPVIPNIIAGQNNIGKNSRLPVKADRFAVNQNNSKLPTPNEENQRTLVNEDDKQGTSKNVNETLSDDNQRKAEADVNQQNPLVLARQKSGGLATTPQQQELSGELVIQNTEQEVIIQSAASDTEQLPVSIKTYLDNSKINADDTDGKNIDYFI